MTFATALSGGGSVTDLAEDISEGTSGGGGGGGGGGGTTVTGITDTLERPASQPFTSPNFINYPDDFPAGTQHPWGIADSGDPWFGSTYGVFLDGASSGVIRLTDFGVVQDTVFSTGGTETTGIYDQIAVLAYPQPDPQPGGFLDVTFDLHTNRPLAGPDSGSLVDPYGGDYILLFVNEYGIAGPSTGKMSCTIGFGGQVAMDSYAPTGGTAGFLPLGIDTTQPFHVNFFQPSNFGTVELRVWQGGSKPASPTLTLPGWGLSNHAVSIEPQTGRSFMAGDLEVHLDNLNVIGRPAGSAGGSTGGTVGGGTGDWTAKPAFLSYPTSSVISMTGQSGFTINAKSFRNQTGSNVISIHLENCSNFVITDCDFDSDTEDIFLHGCANFEIGWCRSNNIIGPHARDGTHRANFVQMDSCTGFYIHDLKLKHGDTEDVISCFKSGGGPAGSLIEHVQIDMTGWTSNSGTGIILGDGGAPGPIEVRYCDLLNPGQVGIQIIDGTGHKVHDCRLYSEPGQPTSPNVAVSSFAGNPVAEVYNMDVYWRKNDGSESPHYFGAGTINAHDNNWSDHALSAGALGFAL